MSPADWQLPPGVSHGLWDYLHDAALARKLAAARTYPSLEREVGGALQGLGADVFREEWLRPAGPTPLGDESAEPPFYERHGEERDRLSAGDFPTGQSVIIRFPDGSQVLFRHAFAIPDEAGREVAVFTDHCGYHVFPLGDAELEVVQSVPTAGDLGAGC